MGKAGRFVCIFTPYVLTIAALICLIVVGLGSTDNGTDSLRDLYFFRADLRDLNGSSSIQSTVGDVLDNLNISVDDGDITAALDEVQKYFRIPDFYNIGLLGYCEGNVTSNNNYKVSNCSSPKAEFWFDPVKVWNLETLGLQNALPDKVDDALNVYRNVSKWMFVAYVIAFAATALELLLGITAIFSRWGSCVTTLIAIAAFLFTAAASATSTAMFAVVAGVFNDQIKPYGIEGHMGRNIYVATWLATAFSLAAALFWAISSCCCSGRSPYNHRHGRNRGGITAEKAPYTYEPVGSGAFPSPQQQHYHSAAPQYPHTPERTTSYEPFRHV
ncbi:SUR7/PalI family-domain-containing protein [Aspergillus pseudodeflectus]|uniref:SUR7/PalI family-domain-containing protein n=1 Tax=Aspergillus pseudodeflectus TaxID=176178 RepID=A0ABR4KCL4_9EURO